MSDGNKIIDEVVQSLDRSNYPLVCNVSNRHCHLSKEHLEKLFGTGYELKKMRDLIQPGEFASTDTIDLMGPKSILKKVRVLGPVRNKTQVEISRTDSFKVGIDVPVRNSGDISGTPGARLIGPHGSVEIAEGIIISRRHIHMSEKDAALYKIKDSDYVRIRTIGPRAVIFNEVLVRVNKNFKLECHIDIDEANACDFKNGEMVYIC